MSVGTLDSAGSRPRSAAGAIVTRDSFDPRPDFLGTPVPPRDIIENLLARLWELQLGMRPIGIDDDYFDLDGDSMSAFVIMERLREEYGVDLEPSLILEHPTIRRLAQVVRDAAEGRDARPIVIAARAEGGLPPLVVLHAVGGHVVFARSFAEAMEPDRPIYGLSATPRLTRPGARPSVEDMAAEYIEALDEVVPDRPLAFAGYSGGGPIAFEMARQRRASGRDVAGLILLDSFYPMTATFGGRMAMRYGRLSAAFAENGLAGGVAHLCNELVERFQRPPDGGPMIGSAALPEIAVPSVTRAISQAIQRYRAEPYDGDALLVVAETSRRWITAEDMGWSRFVRGGVETRAVPGDHRSMFLRPQIERTSVHIRQYLDHRQVR